MDTTSRRTLLRLGACGALLPWLHAQAQGTPVLRRLGVVSVLGDSVRIAAREVHEALFKDVGMDGVVFDAVDRAGRASQPAAELRHFRAPVELDVQDQVDMGLAAARRSDLPAWVLQAAREADLSHVLLVTSSTGAMEFRTAMSQVVGNDTVTGVGFVVSGSGRTKNMQTGAVATGYLAPFVQLRLTLIDMAGPRLVHSTSLSQGVMVGPPETEAPDPWRFLTRAQKAKALDGLMREVLGRGMQDLLAAG